MGTPHRPWLTEREYLEREALAAERRGWLAANLDPGERLEVVCGPVRAELTLATIYEDTVLTVALAAGDPRARCRAIRGRR